MKKALFLVLFLDFIALAYGASTLSISLYEAEIYYQNKGLLYYLVHFSTFLFGQNDFALRTPIIILHFLSACLLYLFALKITKTSKDAFYSLVLFLLLPGTVASALLVSEASLAIFFSLLILCAYEYGFKKSFYILLVLSLFVDGSFGILFLALFFFGIYKKDLNLSLFSLALFGFSMGIYSFETSGKPRGYFLDTLGVFAACFSPIVFIYFFYVIYRFTFEKEKPLIWFVMSTTFVFCLIFSMRQRLYLEDFLPFCVITTPLLIQTLMHSYRVRLASLRLKYNILIQAAAFFLLFCYFTIIFNAYLYAFLDNPNKHFAHNYHEAKELALLLKQKGIKAVKTSQDLQLRLSFYGIKKADELELVRLKTSKNADIKLAFGKSNLYYALVKQP